MFYVTVRWLRIALQLWHSAIIGLVSAMEYSRAFRLTARILSRRLSTWVAHSLWNACTTGLDIIVGNGHRQELILLSRARSDFMLRSLQRVLSDCKSQSRFMVLSNSGDSLLRLGTVLQAGSRPTSNVEGGHVVGQAKQFASLRELNRERRVNLKRHHRRARSVNDAELG